MTAFLPEGKRIDTAENAAYLSSYDAVCEAMARRVIIEGRAVLCDSEHNLSVDLGCMRGFIPREEGALGISDGTVRDIAVISRVGKPVSCIVTDIVSDSDGYTAILSRAQVQRRCITDYVSTLIPGDIVDARITHLEPFGAFCDIGCGVVALMPIDTISVSRIEHPDERFTVGMDIKAVIKSRVGTRVTLSHKELLGTWQENASKFAVGETVAGVVRSIENYGAFIELAPNLAGLAELRDDLKIGCTASVYIKSIIPQKMKVKLIVIEAMNERAVPVAPHYYIDSGHISRFTYSPEGCEKVIITDFAEQYHP